MTDTGAPEHNAWTAALLRDARRGAGLTQAELGKRLEVRLWMVDQWETGRRAIPSERYDALAEALGVEPGDSKADISDLHMSPRAETMSGVPDSDTSQPDLPRAVRGYETGAVHAHLKELETQRDDLAVELEAERSRVAELEERLSTVEAGVAADAGTPTDPSEDEAVLRDVLVTAQRAANEVRDAAHREAAEIAESARRSSEQAIREADEERHRLAEEIRWLESRVEGSRAAVTGLLESLLEEVQARSAQATDAEASPVFDDEVLRPKPSLEDKAEQPESPAADR
jgi:cell division initiation protein